MYLTIAAETGSCRLLIMLGDGPRCKELGDKFFSACTDPMLLQEIFQTPFSNNSNKKKKEKKNLMAGRNTRYANR